MQKNHISTGHKNIQVTKPYGRFVSHNKDSDDLVQSEQLNIGHPVAPKEIKQQVLDGTILSKSSLVSSRQIPLNTIQTFELPCQFDLQLIRDTTPDALITRHWHFGMTIQILQNLHTFCSP